MKLVGLVRQVPLAIPDQLDSMDLKDLRVMLELVVKLELKVSLDQLEKLLVVMVIVILQ